MLWIETDSLLVVTHFKKTKISIPWRLRALWNEVNILMSSMEIRITHIFRQGNQANDMLAKQRESNVWIGHWPTFIDKFWYSDLISIIFVYIIILDDYIHTVE